MFPLVHEDCAECCSELPGRSDARARVLEKWDPLAIRGFRVVSRKIVTSKREPNSLDPAELLEAAAYKITACTKGNQKRKRAIL